MTTAKSRCEEMKERLKLMGDPYASLLINDQVDEKRPRKLSEKQAHNAFRESQNPYARDYYFGDPEESPIPPIEEPQRQSALLVASSQRFSKRKFQTGCQRIFRQYIPFEDGRILRPHHRDFIERNESRSAEERFLIVEQLSRYDLSRHGSYNVRFNRGRDALTEKKLQKIERMIGNEK